MFAQSFFNLLPKNITIQHSAIGDVEGELLPQEAKLVERAVTKRVDEFTTGRLLARQALQAHGIQNFPLLADSKRCPIWPTGMVGSITHTNEFCIVALAQMDSIFSLGIDAESVDRVKPDLWSMLLTEREKAYLDDFSPEQACHWASAIFSLKEAFFKFQFPLTRRMIGFDAIDIMPGAKQHTALLSWTDKGRPKSGSVVSDLQQLTAYYCIENNYSFAAVWQLASPKDNV